MPDKKVLFSFFISLVFLSGCSNNRYYGCKPVLMPYVEYGYKAEDQKLSGDYFLKNEEIIGFHGLTLAVPQGWSFEILFAGRTIKFFKDKNLFFILNFENNIDIRCDIESFNAVGCNNFSSKYQERSRTKKEFYTDLYLFTKDNLNNDPNFWQYYILWSKTELLRDAVKLVHYSGDSLEAFQRIFDPKTACAKFDIVMQSEVFPKKIAPDFIVIASVFRDDAFFVEFLEMLNAMNPFSY